MSEAKEHKISIRTLTPFLVLSIVILIVTMVSGLNVAPEFSGALFGDLKESFAPLQDINFFLLFIFIFLNNTIKALLAIISGFFIGIPSLIFIGFNGFVIGVIISALKPITGYGTILASLLPHGIIEIPLLVLSTALGLMIGNESIKFLMKRESHIRIKLRQSFKIYLKWMIAAFLIAAIIEVLVTPLLMQLIGSEQLLIQ